jgi:putative Holliday junction resolvase
VSRIVGVDHGSRRIGLAVGDTETGIAFARPALQRRSAAVDLDTIAALARDEDASLVVVGLPRNMDGSEGPQAAAARDFGERLAAIGLAVAYVDERLTTWQAAARLILQEYLDAHAPPEPAQETE